MDDGSTWEGVNAPQHELDQASQEILDELRAAMIETDSAYIVCVVRMSSDVPHLSGATVLAKDSAHGIPGKMNLWAIMREYIDRMGEGWMRAAANAALDRLAEDVRNMQEDDDDA
jgi:hypothetical protein